MMIVLRRCGWCTRTVWVPVSKAARRGIVVGSATYRSHSSGTRCHSSMTEDWKSGEARSDGGELGAFIEIVNGGEGMPWALAGAGLPDGARAPTLTAGTDRSSSRRGP